MSLPPGDRVLVKQCYKRSAFAWSFQSEARRAKPCQALVINAKKFLSGSNFARRYSIKSEANPLALLFDKTDLLDEAAVETIAGSIDFPFVRSLRRSSTCDASRHAPTKN